MNAYTVEYAGTNWHPYGSDEYDPQMEEQKEPEMWCPCCGKVYKMDCHGDWYDKEDTFRVDFVPVKDGACIADKYSDEDTPENRERFTMYCYQSEGKGMTKENLNRAIFQNFNSDFSEDVNHCRFYGLADCCYGLGTDIMNLVREKYHEQWQEHCDYIAHDENYHEYVEWIWEGAKDYE